MSKTGLTLEIVVLCTFDTADGELNVAQSD